MNDLDHPYSRVLFIAEKAVEKGVKAVWMQEGIVSPETFQLAKKVGLKRVMDRCIYKTVKAQEGSV